MHRDIYERICSCPKKLICKNLYGVWGPLQPLDIISRAASTRTELFTRHEAGQQGPCEQLTHSYHPKPSRVPPATAGNRLITGRKLESDNCQCRGKSKGELGKLCIISKEDAADAVKHGKRRCNRAFQILSMFEMDPPNLSCLYPVEEFLR